MIKVQKYKIYIIYLFNILRSNNFIINLIIKYFITQVLKFLFINVFNFRLYHIINLKYHFNNLFLKSTVIIIWLIKKETREKHLFLIIIFFIITFFFKDLYFHLHNSESVSSNIFFLMKNCFQIQIVINFDFKAIKFSHLFIV